MFYVILSHVHLFNISYVFECVSYSELKYELQLSFNVIISCNNIQYIVNYKQQFSFSFFFHKICCLITMTNIHSILYYNIHLHILILYIK